MGGVGVRVEEADGDAAVGLVGGTRCASSATALSVSGRVTTPLEFTRSEHLEREPWLDRRRGRG